MKKPDMSDVYSRCCAASPSLPLVFDSPHSGRAYPGDFAYSCSEKLLRQAEDIYVDELISCAPSMGIDLLCAQFPRSYIDPNRAIDDLDPKLLNGPWPHQINPSEKSGYGMGLVRRLADYDKPVYDAKLSNKQIAHRITHYYAPYHHQLEQMIASAYQDFGTVYHINWHSMPAIGAVLTGQNAGDIDFVIGDRDGTTSGQHFSQFLMRLIQSKGYRVSYNDPYKGVEIVRRHGRPETGCHSIQLEINRSLYVDEKTFEKTHNFSRLQNDLEDIIGQIARFVETRIGSIAAE